MCWRGAPQSAGRRRPSGLLSQRCAYAAPWPLAARASQPATRSVVKQPRPVAWLPSLHGAPRVVQSLCSLTLALVCSQPALVLSETAASARAHILAQARLHCHPQRRGGSTRVGHNQLHRFFKVRAATTARESGHPRPAYPPGAAFACRSPVATHT